MKRLIFSLLSCVAIISWAQVGDLQRSTPAAEGVDPAAVARFIDSLLAVPKTELHHVMVVRHGKVIAEAHPAPYRAEDAHTLYSCSKTFTSMAVGIAISENRLRLTDRVLSFFPEKAPAEISDNLAAMTVRDLIIMAAGSKPDWVMRNFESDWIKTWLNIPCTEKPGTLFQYDSMCSFMLSAIVQRVTGMTMLDYLKNHIFNDMHITDVDWQQSPDGINTGGWGLRLQTESLAKFGILLLNGGKWEGKQLVPSEWIAEASQAKINRPNVKPFDPPLDTNRGYCYHMWRSKRDGSFRADGAYGQFVVCIPDKDMVVVINGLSYNTSGELNCIWDYLMPGVDAKIDEKAQSRLVSACGKAALPMPKGKKTGGNLPVLLKLEDNKQGITSIEIDNNYNMTINFKDGKSENIALGYGEWKYNKMNGVPPYSIEAVDRFKGLKHNYEVAGAYAWSGKKKLTVQLEYVNWISAQTLKFDFASQTVTLINNFDTKPIVIKAISQ